MLIQFLYSIPLWLSDFLDCPLDQIYLVLGLFLSVLLGFIFPTIQSPKLRRFLALGLGSPLVYFVYGYQGLTNLFSFSFCVYVILVILPRKWAGFGVCVSAMGYISISHIYRFFYDYGGWTMDTSVMLMYTVIKSTMLGFAYTDGGKQQGSRQFTALSTYQRSHRIIKKPSLYEYMSYMLFYTNAIIGPANQYSDFQNLIENKAQYSNLPSTFKPALEKLAIAVVCIAITVIVLPEFPTFFTADPQFGEWWMPTKIAYYFMAFTLIRIRYYAGWQIADAAARASGAAYRGGQQWELCENADVYRIELGQNEKLIKAYWNRSTAIWLKEYIYQRLIMHKELTGKEYISPVLLTSMVAAFWHGFYPTYYFSFMMTAQLTEVTRMVYRRRNYFKWMNPRIQYFASWFATYFICNFMGTAFTLLRVEMFWQYLLNLYFFPLIMLMGARVLLPLVPVEKKQKLKE